VRRVGELTLPLARRWLDQVVTVSEEEIANAILLLLEIEKTVVEGAGAVPLAALEVRDRQRPVDRRIDRDRHDHENHPAMWCSVRRAYQPARPASPGRATEREAMSVDSPTSFPR